MSLKDQLLEDCTALHGTVEEVDYKRRGYHLEMLVDHAKVRELAQVMWERGFYLVFVSGLHALPALEVHYQFATHYEPCRVMVRAAVDEAGTVPTISDIFQGANWHERETRDMFGIVFTGHPYLQPLLLPEEVADLKPLLKGQSAVKPVEKLRWLPPQPQTAPPQAAAAKPAAPETKKPEQP